MARVLFLQDSGINESLALTDLGAVLRAAGHDVRLILGDEERHLGRALRRADPDLVVIPCPVAGHNRALADAAEVRRWCPDATTVLGGTHATFSPELASRPEVDAVCVGEAEGAVSAMAAAIDTSGDWSGTANLAVEIDGALVTNPMGPPVQDLDSLPLPARDLYFQYPFMARLPWKKFTTGRGCVHRCSYCWNTALADMYEGQGQFVRRKSPRRAVDEVLAIRERFPLRVVHFSDDLFTVHPQWLEEFAPMFRRDVGLPFTCNTSVQLASQRAVEALAEGGCEGVAIGVETGNEELRQRILGKEVTDHAIREAAARIKGQGMRLTTFNMVGAPGETLDDVGETIALNCAIGADSLRVNIAVPLAHTTFEETAFSLGFLGEQHETGVSDLYEPEVQFETPDREALVNLYLLFRPAVHGRVPRRVVRWAARAPNRLLLPLRLWGAIEEKRITGLGWLEGFRFYTHVGDPRKRTANYVTLI